MKEKCWRISADQGYFISFNRSEPKKTKVKKRTLNPKFEESFLFEVNKKNEKKLSFYHRVKQIVSSSSKSQRIVKEEVVPTVIQQQPLLNQIFKELPMIPYWKGRSLRHTCKSKILTKARKPNHLFRCRVGLSTHNKTLILCTTGTVLAIANGF